MRGVNAWRLEWISKMRLFSFIAELKNSRDVVMSKVQTALSSQK